MRCRAETPWLRSRGKAAKFSETRLSGRTRRVESPRGERSQLDFSLSSLILYRKEMNRYEKIWIFNIYEVISNIHENARLFSVCPATRRTSTSRRRNSVAWASALSSHCFKSGCKGAKEAERLSKGLPWPIK